MSRWFASATFVICVHDFPRGEVSVKVGVMEFGLDWNLEVLFLRGKKVEGEEEREVIGTRRGDEGPQFTLNVWLHHCESQ